MKDAQKPDHVNLGTIVERLRDGRYEIPDFQREFEWKPWDIRELIRSIFLDYYIGSLLLWKGTAESFDALACEPLYGYRGDGDGTHIVLDGQQRLTAIYYAFHAPNVPAPSRQNRFLYFIRVDQFMEENYEESFEYDWTQRGVSLLENKTAQFENHRFPLAVVGKGGFELAYWIKEYEQHWQKREAEARERGDEPASLAARRHAENAGKFGEHLGAISQQYQIAYIELDQDIAIEKVCDIFTQINSRGIRLDVFDLINALLKPKGLQLKHLWREARPKLDFVETERMDVYILQVMSILSQAYCSPKYLYYLLPGQEKKVRESDGSLRTEVLVPDIESFANKWHQAVDALARTIERLRNPQMYGAISSRYLPYVSILPAFAALSASIQALPAIRQLDAQKKLQHWYWASVFMNRYSGAVESTSARDFLDLKLWFDDDDAKPFLITDFEARFRNLEMRRETRRGTSVYNGIFNLLVLNGARDWTTGAAPEHRDLDDHHIVPKSWANGRTLDPSIDTILNRTPLTADTNRNVINDEPPNRYLPKLITASGEDTVRATLESHFISPAAFDILLRDPFEDTDFEAFVAERERTFRAAIEHLLVKERLDLPPPLRELDAQVETIELALRGLVCRTLADDTGQLPQHVRKKVDDRVHSALRKNPGLDPEHYGTLAGKLEYADLRELQDTLTNRALCPCSKPDSRTRNSSSSASISSPNCAMASDTADKSTKSLEWKGKPPSCGSNRCSRSESGRGACRQAKGSRVHVDLPVSVDGLWAIRHLSRSDGEDWPDIARFIVTELAHFLPLRQGVWSAWHHGGRLRYRDDGSCEIDVSDGMWRAHQSGTGNDIVSRLVRPFGSHRAVRETPSLLSWSSGSRSHPGARQVP